MTVIRRVGPDDLQAVAQINVDVWRSTYRGIVPEAYLAALDYRQAEERWERFLQRPHSIALAAETDREVVGYAMAGRERSGNENYRGEVYAIYIRDSHHGKGIGRKLLRAVAGNLRTIGIETMLIWVLDGNPAADFYKACGGRIVSHKSVDIGGAALAETAYGWDALAEM